MLLYSVQTFYCLILLTVYGYKSNFKRINTNSKFSRIITVTNPHQISIKNKVRILPIFTPSTIRLYANEPNNNNKNEQIVNNNSNSNDNIGEKESLKQSYIILSILFLAFSSNQWCRQAVYYLCNFTEPNPFLHMNAALGFSQEQYATLASVGFTFFFAISSFIAGSITDKFSRKNILAYSCLAWSIITILEANVGDYSKLLVLRSLLAISQSFFNPAAYTLLSDVFPKQYIGTANGILGGGIYIGGGLASLSILLDEKIGWRATMGSIGAIGLVIVGLILTLVPTNSSAISTTSTTTSKEKLKLISKTAIIDNRSNVSSSRTEKLQEYLDAIADVWRSPGARQLLVASALRFAAGFTIGIWKAPFVFEKFPGSEAIFAGSNAAIVAGGGLASSLLGGYLSDLIAKNYGEANPKVRVWVPAIGSLLAAPLWLGFIKAETPSIAAAYLLAEYLAAECWVGPTLAGLYAEVPVNRRGTAQGIFSFLTAVGNIAPLLVGALVGGKYGQFSLGDSLGVTVSGAYVLSGLIFAYFAASKSTSIVSTTSIITKKKSS